LRPGRILTWRALTNSSSNPRSSSTCHTGFQYWPVASITTWVTPSAASHPASASSPEVKVGNLRTSWARPPRPSGTRTQATTSVLGHIQAGAACHQQLHHGHLLPHRRCARRGQPSRRRCKTCSQQQFVVPGRPPRPSYQRALSHQGKPSLAGHTRFSSLVAATGHVGLISDRRLSAMLSSLARWRRRGQEGRSALPETDACPTPCSGASSKTSNSGRSGARVGTWGRLFNPARPAHTQHRHFGAATHRAPPRPYARPSSRVLTQRGAIPAHSLGGCIGTRNRH
jgi:hypothetical protein